MIRFLIVTPVGNLKTASPFALDHNFAVKRAQFDLPNVTTSDVDFFGDHGRALRAAPGLAPGNIFASVNANRCGRGAKSG